MRKLSRKKSRTFRRKANKTRGRTKAGGMGGDIDNRINDLETLVNKIVMVMVNGPAPLDNRIGLMSVKDVFNKSSKELAEYRAQLLMKVKMSLIQERNADVVTESKRIEDMIEKTKQEAATEAVRRPPPPPPSAPQAAPQAATEAQQAAARVADKQQIETAVELEDNSEPLMVPNTSMARIAAELRAEQTRLRGTQKNRASSSSDPSTWSKEKAAAISQMWTE